MKIWVESVDRKLIEEGVRAGLLHGVVTLPSHLIQGRNLNEFLMGLLEVQPGPVVVDVFTDYEKIGQQLSSLSSRFVLRIPAVEQAWDSLHALSKQSGNVMAGAIFSPVHALLAAVAGAAFVSPHLSRMLKTGDRPLEQIESTQKMISNYQLPSKVMVLHPKSIEQVKGCAESGVAGVIVREDLYKELLESHELAAFHVEQSEAEWKKVIELF